MLFSVELLDLFLYCMQQLGIMLAVGAETIVLIAYLVAKRDGIIDATEARFSRAVHRALIIGLGLIVLSGVAIVLLHFMLAEQRVVLEPVFLFKWLLILSLILIYTWQKGKEFSPVLVEGAVGGTWYALFLVHILAPQTTWGNLFMLYLILLGGFVALWSVLIRASKKSSAPKTIRKTTTEPPVPPIPAAAKVSPPKVPAPMPAQKTAPLVPATLPPTPPPTPVTAATPPKPSSEPEPHHSPWLPAIHVMPQSEKHLEEKAHIIPLGSINKPA